ncbi:MAG: hypothetical protein Q9216_004439 [Gyalolechia sp. 2 TL-2023]
MGSSSRPGEEDGDALATNLASLSLGSQSSAGKSTNPTGSRPLNNSPTAPTSPELSIILMAMRKLREAVVASSRTDDFAKDVYIFIIRTTILLGHPESYHPALLHLFRRLSPFVSSSDGEEEEEEKECIGYYILDLACRQHDWAAAFRIRNLYDHRNWRIDTVLSALVHGNWILFWKVKNEGDEYEKRLIGWADERMGNHALQCLGKSYLSIPKTYVERYSGMTWEDLGGSKKVSWTLDGDTVVIKQVKKK